MGNAIATYLNQCDGIQARSVRLDDEMQGLSSDNLDWAQVLIWWGHVRQHEISDETSQMLVERPDNAPSTIEVLKPEHPIAKGLPKTFTIAHTEMYNEPFHVPEPDEVIFKETWAKGEWFRSGCIWQLGKGRVFYLRPGHETFAVYLQPVTLQLLEDAARWLARS